MVGAFNLSLHNTALTLATKLEFALLALSATSSPTLVAAR